MNLSKYITATTIKLDLAGQTPEEIMREMIAVLCDAHKMNRANADEALRALMRREKMMSTGLANGVAIPHAKTGGVDDLVGALGIKPGGIDFGALDGKPSTIFVMTLSPKGKPAPHVPFLAEVAKVLQRSETCERVVNARTPHEVIDILFC